MVFDVNKKALDLLIHEELLEKEKQKQEEKQQEAMLLKLPENKEKLNNEYKECEKLLSKENTSKDRDNDSGITKQALEEEEKLIRKLTGMDIDNCQKIGEKKKPTLLLK